MKKFFLVIFALGTAYFLVPSALNAASINVFSQVKSERVGNTFALTIVVDPSGEKIFTTKATLSYPPEILKIISFTFSDVWMPLNQPDFNEINNKKGLITKTGGYPAGISSPVSLGIIKFIAIKEGSARVSVTDDSIVLNDENKNILTKKGDITFAFTPALPEKQKGTLSETNEKPITKTIGGTLVPARFIREKIPSDIPSPDKAWLYTKLAFFSAIALILGHKWTLYIIIGVLFYMAWRIFRRR